MEQTLAQVLETTNVTRTMVSASQSLFVIRLVQVELPVALTEHVFVRLKMESIHVTLLIYSATLKQANVLHQFAGWDQIAI
jgi:hypothetical protein